MRIALLTPTYWPEVRRGTERVVHDLAAGCARRGHDVRIVTSTPGRRSRAVEAGGVRVVRVHRPWAGPTDRLGLPAHSAHVPLALAALLAGRDDVAHAFFPTDALAANAWRRARRRASVFSVMGLPSARSITAKPRSAPVWRSAVGGASAVTALGLAAADAVRTHLHIAPRVLRPGVDLDAFAPDGPRDPVPTILCNGAMEDGRKRVPLLLEAFALVRAQRPDAVLLLNRPGDPALAARATAAGAQLVDPLAEPGGFRRLYSRAWVSALASEAEAWGLVFAEALACGTPAVGADEGGAQELLDDPAVGRRFAAATPDAVATALLEALALAEQPGTAERCRAQAARFSVDRMVDEHLALYEELCA